ncbi:hypothetical protein RND71_017930 [Anisodus tanguticus]|uniref:Protein kinase domain-containing protein n=1 Tax=Anisodus tanguticus TaxID=243964 RepID=A0AAE1S4E3_9SOLA|nr:hypothetical protein RND71_017930 [Anisodus tanguticus]
MPKGNLDEWLYPEKDTQKSSLTILQRMNIIIDVASALHYLHHQCQAPMIHCDIKPQNILLDDDLTAHLGDFGLVRLVAGFSNEPNLHQFSSLGVMGTIDYTAPELKNLFLVIPEELGDSLEEIRGSASGSNMLGPAYGVKSIVHIEGELSIYRMLDSIIKHLFCEHDGFGWNLSLARELFDSMLCRNEVSWTTMIGGYSQNNQPEEAFNLYTKMCRSGVKPDHVTFATLLSGFDDTTTLREVLQIHAHII